MIKYKIIYFRDGLERQEILYADCFNKTDDGCLEFLRDNKIFCMFSPWTWKMVQEI